MLGGYNSTQLGHVYVTVNVNMNMTDGVQLGAMVFLRTGFLKQ